MDVVSAFPPLPKASARLAEARFAREGGRRTVVSAVLLALALAVPLLAQSGDRARTEALARRAAERLQSLQREADHLASEERTLLGELRKLELDQQIKTEELQQLQREHAQIATDLAATDVRMRQLEHQDRAARPDLRARLVEIYKRGQGGYLRLLLSTSDLRQIGQASRTIAALAKLDRDSVGSHRRRLDELKAARATLEERNRRLQGVTADAERAQTAARQAAQARANLISNIDRRRDLNAQFAGELAAAQQKLQVALRDLAGGLGVVEPAVLPLRPFRGDLDWPVAGGIRRSFARTATSGSPSNGIEIAADEGAPVAAIHEGIVAFAGSFSGFGNLVILDHGAQTFSLYGNLLELAVKKGARIPHGQPVGTVGSAATGAPGLYFELRVDGQPVDPLQWLKRR